MIGVTTTREPEFDARQLSLLLSHQRQMADIGPHGQPMSEATDPRADPSVEGGWHYEAVENGITDYAALTVATARNRYFELHGKKLTEAQKSAKHWTVRKVVDS